ncbi:MAG: PorT family protein [Flavobacteriales bacterium]|nr:PorT family protein [Flavobacteriales bacterium]
MRKVLLTAAVALTAGATMAQMNIGAKAGLNYNIWGVAEGDQFPSGAEKPDSESGIGFHLGGYAEIGLSDNLAFRPELLYSARGVKSDVDETETFADPLLGTYTITTKGEDVIKAGYLEVPLLLAYKPSDAFGIHFGPVLGFRMGWNYSSEGTASTNLNGQVSEQTYSIDSSDDTGVNGLDLGLAAGFAYELESGLNFGLRYARSLTTTNDDSQNGALGSTDFVKVNQNIFQLSLGYTFMKN